MSSRAFAHALNIPSVPASAVAAAVAFAAVAGVATTIVSQPVILLGFLACVGMVITFALKPQFGAYVWLMLCPLIVGIARGEGLLVLRPNEMLLLIIAAGVGVRILWDYAHETPIIPPLHNIDVSIVLLAIFGSIIPLLLAYGRGIPIVQDDVLYAMVFIKYFVLYAVFRFGVRSKKQVATCLKVTLFSGCIVAITAGLQVRDLLSVPQFLDTYYDGPFEGVSGPITSRASSTIASSFGLADLMAMCLAITVAMATLVSRNNRILLFGAGLLFLGGCISAASFSGFIGGSVAVVIVGLLTGHLLGQLAIFVPAAALGTAFFWSAISSRLDGFSNYQSLPPSWLGRLENLERFFWPEVFSGWNWLLGVRPAARVAAPEAWREWVYIESGHTWLLWTGGLPLLLVFFILTWAVVDDLYVLATKDKTFAGVAAIAALAATAMIFVLMMFDPHLTVRGSADLYFPLLALALVSLPAKRVIHKVSTSQSL